MKTSVEAFLLFGAATLGGFGVILVNLASGDRFDTHAGFTFLLLSVSFGLLWFARGRYAPRAPLLLFAPLALLLALSVIEIHRISVEEGQTQLWLILLGSALATISLRGCHRAGLTALSGWLEWLPFVFLGLILLPLIPANTWFPLRGVETDTLLVELDLSFWSYRFSPWDLAVVCLVVYLSWVWADREPRVPTPRGWGTQASTRRLVYGLIWVGSAGIAISRQNLGLLLLVGGVLIGIAYITTAQPRVVVLGLVGIGTVGVSLWSLSSSVQNLFTVWLHPYDQASGVGYDLAQGIYALGSGSLAGSGFGLGQPELVESGTTQFLLAAVGEEMGFAGTTVVLVCLSSFLVAGFGIALRARQRFRSLLAAGLTLLVGIQTLLSLGAALRLFPPTGLSAPFFYAGGVGILANFLVVALLLRISHEETW